MRPEWTPGPVVASGPMNRAGDGGDGEARRPGEVTLQLRAAGRGDPGAYERAFELVHADLRRLASSYLRRERPEHTLEPTALVHEAFVRLGDDDAARATDRGHFFALAARAMRQVLVDHARGRVAAKRGGGGLRVTLDDAIAGGGGEPREIDILAIDQALTRLADRNERQARVVELRMFAGLTIVETAEALGVSTPTVKADWLVAKRWLRDELTR